MQNRLLLLLFLALLSYCQGQSQTIDTLVDVGNHQLHFTIMKGTGTPILFESGNGDDGSVWNPLMQKIHAATGATLIAYDRAGLGKSGIDTTTISFQGEIKELNKALKKLGYKKDYFLVAHSFGGFYASEFAQRNKGKISGAVFIDVSTPCALNIEYASKVNSSISAENWALIKQYKTGLYYVLKSFPNTAEYMSENYIPNSIPLTVIAAETRKPTIEIGETEQDMLNMTNCLKDFGTLPNHKYVFASNTEHKVWENSPELVIQEIIELYKKTTQPNR